MRRFFAILILLILTLVVGKSASAHSVNVWASPVESHFDEFSSIYLPHGIGSFDERPTRHRSSRRSRDFPREVRGKVRFRLRDRDYERVYVTGTFTDWDDVAMELDESGPGVGSEAAARSGPSPLSLRDRDQTQYTQSHRSFEPQAHSGSEAAVGIGDPGRSQRRSAVAEG